MTKTDKWFLSFILLWILTEVVGLLIWGHKSPILEIHLFFIGALGIGLLVTTKWKRVG